VRVLVVDDEPRMAALLKRGLADEGYVVDVATTGPDALSRALEFDYDAVLLDVMLPGMSGIEVCRQLRERKCWVTVLMITAADTIEDRTRALDVGADEYLIKPFSLDVLAARIRALAGCRAIEPVGSQNSALAAEER
jgi:two-component system OmpR family response regulator